jgi:hypothetical protein
LSSKTTEILKKDRETTRDKYLNNWRQSGNTKNSELAQKIATNMSRRSSVVNSDSSSSSGKYQKGNKSALKSSVSKKDLLINRSRLASFG